MLRLTFTGLLISILCGCASDSNQIQIVKSSVVEDWAPNSIENQISLWDCTKIDWDVIQKHADYSVVSASCKGQKPSADGDKPDIKMCVHSQDSDSGCLQLLGATRQIQFRFLVHQDKKNERVAVLDVKDLHLVKDNVVFEKPLSRSEVQRGPERF